jgi:hypothetical protein
MKHGGCRISARRESTRTAFRLLQHNEKNSVRLNETCTRCTFDVRRCARAARSLHEFPFAQTLDGASCVRCRHCISCDEIRIYCDVRIRLPMPTAHKNRTRARRNLPRSRSRRADMHSKKFLHNLPRARVPRGRNRSKKSESVPSDSRDMPPPTGKFLRRAHLRFGFEREVLHERARQVR